MKKLLLALAILTPLAGCNNDIAWGKLNFDYVYVKSSVIGERYFHISRWKEFGPDPSDGLAHYYVGLEFTTYSSKVDYYLYELDLEYCFTAGRSPLFGEVSE